MKLRHSSKTSARSPRSQFDLREYALNLAKLDQADILKELGIKHYDRPILKMTTAEILAEFCRRAKRLDKGLFIRNVIWQTYEQIQTGHNPFAARLIRSFWYYIKPTMDRIGANKKGDPYLIISDMFVTMVKAGLFKYKDFRFKDQDRNMRWHARKHPHVIVFAEKGSSEDFLQELTRDFDVTTIATSGQISYLSVEYFVDELRARKVDLSKEFVLFSVVDFDPAGDIIATKFAENLEDNGIRNLKIFTGFSNNRFKRKDLVVPANMTPEQKKSTYRLPLAVRKSGLAAEWAGRTGGIDGKKNIRLGIEADAMPEPQLKTLFATELSKILYVGLEAIAKYREMDNLKTKMEAFALKKLQLEPAAPPAPRRHRGSAPAPR